MSLRDRIGNRIAYLEGAIDMAKKLEFGGVTLEEPATVAKLEFAHEVLSNVRDGDK